MMHFTLDLLFFVHHLLLLVNSLVTLTTNQPTGTGCDDDNGGLMTYRTTLERAQILAQNKTLGLPVDVRLSSLSLL